MVSVRLSTLVFATLVCIASSIASVQATPTGYVVLTDGNDDSTLVELTGLTDPYRLESPTVAIFNDYSPDPTNAAPGPNPHYLYSKSNPHFAEVNAYYHIHTYVDTWLANLGFEGFGHQLIARVNSDSETVARPTLGLTNFWLQGSYNYALATDIIVHETTHHLIHLRGLNKGLFVDELWSMDEALADYFAAAFTEDAAIGEYVDPEHPTCPAGITQLDSDPDVYKYSNKGSLGCGTSAWVADGMILSGALWDLRQVLGASITDQLVFDALEYLEGAFSFSCFANAVVRAEWERYGGEYLGEIVAAFEGREIEFPIGMTVTGPSRPLIGTDVEYQAFGAGCGLPPLDPFWILRGNCTPSPCNPTSCTAPWQVLGTGETKTVSVTGDFEMRTFGYDLLGRFVNYIQYIDAVRTADPPAIEIDGPTAGDSDEVFPFTSEADGDEITYQWFKKYETGSFNAIPGATNSSVDIILDPGTWRIRCVVTDYDCRSTGSTVHTVEVGQGGDLARQPDLEIVVAGTGASAELRLAAPARTDAHLSVVDVAGRRVATVWKGELGPEGRRVAWDASRLESGVYFYSLAAAGESRVKRFVVVK